MESLTVSTNNIFKVNDLDGNKLAYACCVAKKLDVRLLSYTRDFVVFPVTLDTLKYKSLNSCKHFRLSGVLPFIQKINQINLKMHSGWQAHINEDVMFTAPTFFEVVAKVFVYIKIGNTIHIPSEVCSSNEPTDNYFFCSEDEA